MTTATRRAAAVAAATLLGLSACGGGDEPATTSDPSVAATPSEPTSSEPAAELKTLPDACQLLSQETIAAATGLPFGPAEPNEQLTTDERQVCDWVSQDPFAIAQVLIFAGDDADFQASRESAEEVAGTADADVAGADAAYRTDEGSIFAMLVGDLYVQVSYIPSGPGEVTDVTRQLAEEAVANL